MTLAADGFVYGAIGVSALGVSLDYGLLAGATLLGIVLGHGGFSAATRAQRMHPHTACHTQQH